MAASVFNVAGAVEVSVADGLGDVVALFERELFHGAVPSPSARIRVQREEPPGPLRAKFGVTAGVDAAGRFLCADGKGGWCHVDFSGVDAYSPFELDVAVLGRFDAAVLLEWLVVPLALFGLAQASSAPLHASGLAVDGTGVVFAAWSGVGKTNLLLAGLGLYPSAAYLGDDAVLVRCSGEALPSSRTVSVYGYNRHLVRPRSRRQAWRLATGGRAKELAAALPPAAGRVRDLATYVANAVSNVRVPVALATSGLAFPVERHVVCMSAPEADRPHVAPAGADAPRLAAAHAAVLDYEHVQFQRYLAAWRWSAGGGRDPWRQLAGRWRDTLHSYFRSVGTVLELRLPVRELRPDDARDTWKLVERA